MAKLERRQAGLLVFAISCFLLSGYMIFLRWAVPEPLTFLTEDGIDSIQNSSLELPFEVQKFKVSAKPDKANTVEMTIDENRENRENRALDEIIEGMEEAVVTYSASGVAIITPHLSSADAAVRSAALDALTRLGHRSGALVLRDAAMKLSDPREMVEYMNIADYLEMEELLEEAILRRDDF